MSRFDSQADAPVRRVCIFAQLARTGLGDLIMRNTLFGLVRRAYPEAHVTLVLGANDAADFEDFLRHHALVDDVLAVPPCDAPTPSEAPQLWQPVIDELRARRFDACVVDAGTLALQAGVADAAGIPVRVGILRGHPEEAQLTAAAPIVARDGGMPDLADFLDAYATALGVEPLAPQDRVPPLPFQPEGPDLQLPHPRIAIHVGGGTYWNRRWPLERYVTLLDRLLATTSGSIVLVGNQEEREHAFLRERVDPRGRDRLVEIGDVSLARTATILSQCDVFAGSDSGPMHLAVALPMPTVTLYGPADGELFWDHVYLDHHPIGRHWPCQRIPHDWPTETHAPCAHHCRYSVELDAPEYPRCVADITVDEVFDEILKVLDRLPATAR